MGFLIPLIFIGVIAAIIINNVKDQTANDAWSDAAKRLGFHYEAGGWKSLRKLSGRVDGVFVMAHVYSRGSGKSRRSYTGYRAQLSRKPPAGMRLEAQGIFSGVAEFFGSQDLEIGSKEFDGAVIIKGSNASRIAEFLTPIRKIRILSLMRQFSICEISADGVFVANRGVESDPANLVAILNRISDISLLLTDKKIENETPATPPPLPGPPPAPPELEPESEAYEFEEYAGEPEPVVAETPEEIIIEPELAASEPEPSRPPPPIEPAAAVEPEPELPPEPAPKRSQSEIAKVCNAVFLEPSTRYEATRTFDTEFRGQTVRWIGELQTIEHFSYDLVFKNGPGLIGRFKLHEIEGHPYSLSEIKAAVQLPLEDGLEDKLKSALGEPMIFTGQLEKCDPFAGVLFVANGTVVF
ncbi:MAG: hypothetical protein ACI8UO_005583 [Verrucomicrobiales bacterium]|jgi:hypothetical protein